MNYPADPVKLLTLPEKLWKCLERLIVIKLSCIWLNKMLLKGFLLMKYMLTKVFKT